MGILARLESLLIFGSVVILVYRIKWNLFLVEKIGFQNRRGPGDFPATLFRIHPLGYLFLEKEKKQ